MPKPPRVNVDYPARKPDTPPPPPPCYCSQGDTSLEQRRASTGLLQIPGSPRDRCRRATSRRGARGSELRSGAMSLHSRSTYIYMYHDMYTKTHMHAHTHTRTHPRTHPRLPHGARRLPRDGSNWNNLARFSNQRLHVECYWRCRWRGLGPLSFRTGSVSLPPPPNLCCTPCPCRHSG